MATTTVNGLAGDGHLILSGYEDTWTDAVAQTSADSVSTSGNELIVRSQYNTGYAQIYRSYIYFETDDSDTGIDSGVSIESVKVWVYISEYYTATGSQPSDKPSLVLYEGMPSYPSESGGSPNLSVGDFDISQYSSIGSKSATALGSTQYGIDPGPVGWHSFSISTSLLNRSGLTKLMLATQENSTTKTRYIEINSGNAASYKPYLEIETSSPTVTTQSETVIVPGGATLNGNITADGGASITEHGFCWKAGSDPVNIAGADGYSELGAGSTGAFDQDKTGLTEDTTYYYRAYATSSEGTGYGDAVSFITGETLNGAVAISSVSSIVLNGDRLRLVSITISAVPSISAFGKEIVWSEVAISSKAVMYATEGPRKVFALCRMSSDPSFVSSAYFNASGNASIVSSPSVVANGTANFSSSIDIESSASLVADCIRRDFGTVTINAVSEAEIDAIAYVAQLMGYTGTLTAGDVLVIDCDEQTVELNGSNATRYFTGDFPQLYVGTNELRWKDDDASRDVTLKTDHKPRYL